MPSEPHSSHRGEAQRELGGDDGAMVTGMMASVNGIMENPIKKWSESVCALVKLSQSRSQEVL